MKSQELEPTCERCRKPIDDCECVCPYCGEPASGCECCIGYEVATGG